MSPRVMMIISLAAAAALMMACAMTQPIPTTRETVEPASSVTFKGTPHKLLGTPLETGQGLPSVELVDASDMRRVDLSVARGVVLLLSIVPSLDTAVCEEQTHRLGEEGAILPAGVRRIVISRDTPFAQQRFAREADLEMLQYLSDYRTGEFGRATGLLIEDLMLLARAVVIVDQQGLVRYIQVVPEITELPDMQRAFDRAEALASGP